jgi:hypothetical protein
VRHRLGASALQHLGVGRRQSPFVGRREVPGPTERGERLVPVAGPDERLGLVEARILRRAACAGRVTGGGVEGGRRLAEVGRREVEAPGQVAPTASALAIERQAGAHTVDLPRGAGVVTALLERAGSREPRVAEDDVDRGKPERSEAPVTELAGSRPRRHRRRRWPGQRTAGRRAAAAAPAEERAPKDETTDETEAP